MTEEQKKIGEEALAKLKALKGIDTERAHIEADDILCELLKKLGFTEIVEVFEKMDKWYS